MKTDLKIAQIVFVSRIKTSDDGKDYSFELAGKTKKRTKLIDRTDGDIFLEQQQ